MYTTDLLAGLLAKDLAYRDPRASTRGKVLRGLGPCGCPRPLTSAILAINQNYEIKQSCVRVMISTACMWTFIVHFVLACHSWHTAPHHEVRTKARR